MRISLWEDFGGRYGFNCSERVFYLQLVWKVFLAVSKVFICFGGGSVLFLPFLVDLVCFFGGGPNVPSDLWRSPFLRIRPLGHRGVGSLEDITGCMRGTVGNMLRMFVPVFDSELLPRAH